MLFTLILAVWGFVRYIRGQGVDGSYLGAVVIAEGLIIVQGLIGGVLYGIGARPERPAVHILYGLTALVSYPALFAYTRGGDTRFEQFLWALVSLFVWGLIIRAQQVAM
ncbi:MAG: hypothetical protein M3220_11915 [Chloroflexota bacterium]|nr:hypothetical protein [Chloroflexota bacterium]